MDHVKTLRDSYTQVVDGALACLSLRLQHPCLVLIYTLMDSLAWACSDKTSGGVRGRFEQWVTAWLNNAIPCTAVELYAARCAILHTSGSEVEVSEPGNVRELAYAWGTASADDLQQAITRTGNLNLVVVHIDQFLDAVCAAMNHILDESTRDEALRKRLEDAARRHLVNDTRELVEQFLARSRDA